jgi:hypothetical protein
MKILSNQISLLYVSHTRKLLQNISTTIQFRSHNARTYNLFLPTCKFRKDVDLQILVTFYNILKSFMDHFDVDGLFIDLSF